MFQKIKQNIDEIKKDNYELSIKEIEEQEDYLKPISKLISYRFVTPWVALNQATGNRYRSLKNEERASYLNNLLGQNIVFISREMGIELDNNIFTKVKLSSLFPKTVDENNWGAFDGEFETNFILPNYLVRHFFLGLLILGSPLCDYHQKISEGWFFFH